MQTALKNKDVYADFEPKADTYFFRIGVHGLVSFHGKNYALKQRMTAEQRKELTHDDDFVQISSNCYVNIGKISAIKKQYLYFGDSDNETNRVAVSNRKQQLIRERLAE